MKQLAEFGSLESEKGLTKGPFLHRDFALGKTLEWLPKPCLLGGKWCKGLVSSEGRGERPGSRRQWPGGERP